MERRQLWYKRWDEWAQEDPRIRVDVWKEALNELDRRNGLEYAETLGEVSYRKEVVATACTIVPRSLQDEVLPPIQGHRAVLLRRLMWTRLIIFFVGFFVLSVIIGNGFVQ